MLKQRTLNVIITIFIIAAIIVALSVTQRRVHFENKDITIETVMSDKAIQQLVQLGAINEKDLLPKIKEAGITSIALEEDTLAGFENRGQLTLLKGSEVMNLYRVGHVNRFILNYLYKQVNVKPDHFYLIVEKTADFERIRDYLRVEFGKDKVKTIGRRKILEVQDLEEDLLTVGLGISQDRIKTLEKNGFSVVLRLKNSDRLNDKIVKQKFQAFEATPKDRLLIFEGDSVLGYPSLLALTHKKMVDSKLNLGIVEFAKQRGMTQLAKRMPENLLRLHSIPPENIDSMSPHKAVKRYIRAIKERRIHMIMVHPYLQAFQDKKTDTKLNEEARSGLSDIVAFNLSYISDISKAIKAAGFQIGVGGIDKVHYQPIVNWEILMISLGVWSILLALIRRYVALSLLKTIAAYGLFATLMYVHFFFGYFPNWTSYMALLAAIGVPTLVMISQFPKRGKVPDKRPKRLLFATFFLCRVVILSILGSTLIVALLSDISYLFKVDHFWGVKISFIVPLILVGVYFFLRPNRLTSIVYVFKRMFYAPVRTSSLIAVLFSLSFIFIYTLRSGNYMSFSIPIIETNMRIFLEENFLIRPRTKEFLIGYPFLMAIYYYIDSKVSRDWLWFYNIIAAVAPLSIVNSFCHLHTPVMVSVYRCLFGLVLGVGIALLAMGSLKLVRLILKRMH